MFTAFPTLRLAACCVATVLLLAACSQPQSATRPSDATPPVLRAAAPTAHDLRARLAAPETRGRLAEMPAAATRLRDADPAALAAAFRDFSEWAAAYAAADEAARTDLVAAGAATATARRGALKTLIELDPELALQLALPAELRALLPAEFAGLLEQPVSATGNFLVDISCGLPEAHGQPGTAHQDTINRTFTAGETTYQAFVYGRRLGLTSKLALPVHGIALDGLLAISEHGARVISAPEELPVRYLVGDEERTADTMDDFDHIIAALDEAELAPGPGGTGGGTAESPWTEGAKTLLYIRVAFSDNPTLEPLSLATAQAHQDAVDTFYRDNSYGKTSVTTTFTPLLVLPNTEAYYNGQSWTVLLDDARAAALAAGYNSANYTLHTVATKKLASMTWAGRAFVGQAPSHLNGDFTIRVAAHEFGHNFGLYHANYNYTPGESPLSREAYAHAPENSPSQQYGHRYHMMGASGTSTAYHFSAREKQLLDWLPVSDSPIVLQSGIHRLHRHDHRDATGVRSLRVPAGDGTRAHFWLSHRRNFSSVTNNFGAGLEVLWGRPTNVSDGTLLVDMTPFSNDGPHSDSSSADNSDKADAALTEGRMFGSADSGAWFTVIGQGGTAPDEYMDVAIHVGNFSRNLPPAVSLSPATATVGLGQSVVFTADATDPEGDTVHYSWEFGDGSVAGNQASATKSWNSTGHYVVRVVAVDGKGGTASARAVIRVGSPSTFTATGRVLANGQPVEGVRVFNGLVGSSYRGTRTDSDGYYTLPNLAAGTHTLDARKDGHVFAPAFANPAEISADTAGLDFTATSAPGRRIVVDNTDAAGVEITGSWTSLLSAHGFYAHDYVTDNNTGKGTKQITYRPDLPEPGLYRVSVRYTQSTNRATNAPVDIGHADGVNTFAVDQTKNGGTWFYLGTFPFAAGTSGFARVRTAGTTGHVAADAFLFERTDTQEPTVRLVSLQDTAAERGLTPALVRIEREGPLGFPLTVHLATDTTAEGSSQPGLDFVPLPTSVTIPAGADHYDLHVTPLADTDPEGDETLVVQLRQPPPPSQAWEFDDATGTALTAVANTGGVSWTADLEASTTTGGVLRIRRATGNATSWAVLPEPNPTVTQYLVLRTAAWTLSGTAYETVRLGFTTGTNTTVTAQMLIARTASDGMTLAGAALGTGGTEIAPVTITPNTTVSEPWTFVLAADPVARTYTISYRQGDTGAFTTIGAGTIAPDRAFAALRLNLSNSFNTNSAEKFDIDRIALTTADPTAPAYFIASPAEAEVTIKDDPRDDWRWRRFDATSLANPALTAWDADPDGDGLNNLLEYAFNRDPLAPDPDAALSAPGTVQEAGQTFLSLIFMRRTDDPGLLYQVQGTGDLGAQPWPDTGVLHEVLGPAGEEGYEQVRFRDSVPLGAAARRFLRLRLQLDP